MPGRSGSLTDQCPCGIPTGAVGQPNVLAVANALRALAEQIERAAWTTPDIPDSDWEKAGRIKPRRPHCAQLPNDSRDPPAEAV